MSFDMDQREYLVELHVRGRVAADSVDDAIEAVCQNVDELEDQDGDRFAVIRVRGVDCKSYEGDF